MLPQDQEEAATLMASFWDDAYSEFNLSKALAGGVDPDASLQLLSAILQVEQLHVNTQDTGPRIKLGRKLERERPSPESLSYVVMRHRLFDRLTGITKQREQQCWQESYQQLNSCRFYRQLNNDDCTLNIRGWHHFVLTPTKNQQGRFFP